MIRKAIWGVIIAIGVVGSSARFFFEYVSI